MSADRGPGPARLLLGPLLRFVDAGSATIWVETDRPCTVRILDVSEPTWTVHGHHYALLVLAGLEPASEIAYQVHLDDDRVWPLADNPPSLIRTFSPTEDLRLAFGSCRRSAGDDPASLDRFGADALVALSRRMRTRPTTEWPDALFLGGDQVYADEPSPALAGRLRERHLRAHGKDPAWKHVVEETQDFEEYTWLYHDSWNRPDVRWLLSTVPSMMLLDDHDLRDDWNTSERWRRKATARPWWRQRVIGAFASYWVYQHLGNLSPAELAEDELFTLVRTAAPQSVRDQALDEFAWTSDRPESARWSFIRDFGTDNFRVRFVAIDVRCSRVLNPAQRALLDDTEHGWLEQAIREKQVDHLLLGSPLPALMVDGIHHLEGWNEAVAAGRYGQAMARIAEAFRRKVDLEHWAAFGHSLTRLTSELGKLARGPHAPASILVLSGDVHCSFVATAALPGVDPARTGVHQLTMSPFRNPLEPPIRWANRLLRQRPVGWLLRGLATRAGAEPIPAQWQIAHGLWFDNGVMTVVLHSRQAGVLVDHAYVAGDQQLLRRTASLPLTAGAPTPR